MVIVSGIRFTKRNVYGDFEWMIAQSPYDDVLFIYNDNLESHKNLKYTKKGLGNAIIRPYRFTEPQRAASLPTGFRPSVGAVAGFINVTPGGFQSLSDDIRKVIDDAIDEIRQLLATQIYKRVFYSEGNDGLIGTSIFKVDDEVRKYITQSLQSL